MSLNVISDSFILGFVTGLLVASVCWYYAIQAKLKKMAPVKVKA